MSGFDPVNGAPLPVRECDERGRFVNKHRRRTPGYVRANPLIEFVNLADNRGPDRRRSGPYPDRISSCYIKALRSSELGSRFGAYSQIVASFAPKISAGGIFIWVVIFSWQRISQS